MMRSSTVQRGVSAPPLSFAFVLMIAAVVAVGGARLAGVSPEQSLGASEVMQSRLLRFEDAAQGRVAVIDAQSGATVAFAEPGTNGFLRGALRGLMRVRKRGDVSRGEPYRLDQLANGQLLLTDTASGIAIDLNAYGQTNAAVFRAFLTTTGDKS